MSLVVIRSYPSELEATLAQGELEAAGIPSGLLRDDLGGMHPALGFVHGVRLLIRHEDAIRAGRVLEAFDARPPVEDFDDDEPRWASGEL